MLIRDEGKLHVRMADNLMDAEAFIQTAPRIWPEKASSHERRSEQWDLNAGWDGALRLAREGWSEGARRVEFEAAQVTQIGDRPHIAFDVAGEFPDVARFCAGEPLHMVRHKRDRKPVVHLLVNVCCSASISAKSFAAYGGAVAALVDQLENSDHRVELDVVAANAHSGRGRSLCGWKVKQASDPVDMAAIAFSIAHPAAFRRLVFAMWERLGRELFTYGYGSVTNLTREDAEVLDCPDAILLDGVGVGASGNGVTAKEMNLRLARNVEKALGVKILEEV